MSHHYTARKLMYEAGNAWDAEGRRVYGTRWSETRFTSAGTGALGSELRKRADEYAAAREAYAITYEFD